MAPNQSCTTDTASRFTLVAPVSIVSAGTRPAAELTGDFAPRSASTPRACNRAGSVGSPMIGVTGVSSSVARTIVAESRMRGGSSNRSNARDEGLSAYYSKVESSTDTHWLERGS